MNHFRRRTTGLAPRETRSEIVLRSEEFGDKVQCKIDEVSGKIDAVGGSAVRREGEDIRHNEVWGSCDRAAVQIAMGMGKMRDRSLAGLA